MTYIFARTERKPEWYCKNKDNNLRFWGGEVMSWWVCEFVSLWGDEFVRWRVDEGMRWWVYELISWRVGEGMRGWACEVMSLWIDDFLSWCIQELSGFSWVYKPESWFVLHFIYERSVYLVLGTTKITSSSQFIGTLAVKTASICAYLNLFTFLVSLPVGGINLGHT